MEVSNAGQELDQHRETSKQKAEGDAQQAGPGAVPAAQTEGSNAERARLASEVRKGNEKPDKENAGGNPAAAQMANATGGLKLPDDVREKMEKKLKADFSNVRVHTGPEAEKITSQVKAPAVTMGTNIFLGPGINLTNEEIVAHELAHVVQQGGAKPKVTEASLGGRDNAAEKEAEKVGEAVKQGKEVPAITPGTKDPSAAQRFGAGKYGHGGIEAEAATGSKDPAKDDPRKQGLSEMYSGNFMRDMNQLNVPKIIEGLEGLPKDATNPKAGQIGARGAHDITSAIIQSMAILELGPKTAGALVTGGEKGKADNIGTYKPEEHIDNPMGTGAADLVVKNTNKNAKDKNGNKIDVGAPRVAEQTVDAMGGHPIDADRDAQIQGSAIKGSQVENPKLYEVSGAGLSNHIYNSVESTKGRWLKASEHGPSPLGRMEYGAGSHAVEDYFSHSNFIEVAMNSYVQKALDGKGKKGENKDATKFAETVANNNKKAGGASKTKQGYYVDTLYDAKVDSPSAPKGAKAPQRQAVTTGSFGGDDTKVSIAHILLPALPKLQNAMMKSIDQMFVVAAKEKDGKWDRMKKALSGTPEGAAASHLLEGFANAGVVAPVPDLTLNWKNIPISPGIFGDPWMVKIPSGIDHMMQSVPVTDAASFYLATYGKAHDMIAMIEKYAAYLKKVFIPIQPLIDSIHGFIANLESQIKIYIKERVTEMLVKMVDQLSGRNEMEKKEQEGRKGKKATTDLEMKRDLGDALHHFEESVEETEEKTSVESRLKNGDLSQMPKAKVEALVGPVNEVKEEVIEKDGKKSVRKYYVSTKPLPPSHSEIAKDHESHSEHGKDGEKNELERHKGKDEKPEPGHEAGSPFFSVARALALEAVKLSDAQLQHVWASRPGVAGDRSLFGDGKEYEYKDSLDPANSKKREEGVGAEADKRAASERDRSAKEGTSFLQRDAKGKHAETMKWPGVERLMNMVDEFCAHPDDVTWWRPIVDNLVAKDPQPIYDSILRRNSTRGARNVA